MANDDPNDGWKEWSKHVLLELKRLNNKLENVDIHVQNTALEIAMLKVKSGVWGLIGGIIPVFILIAVQWFTAK